MIIIIIIIFIFWVSIKQISRSRDYLEVFG